MIFVIDEDVPVSVVAFFRKRGHTVHESRETLGVSAKDPTIVELAEQLLAIVVTKNRVDFDKMIARRLRDAQRDRFPHVGALYFQMKNERTILQRLELTIELIEAEDRLAALRRDRRVFIIIKDGEIAFRR